MEVDRELCDSLPQIEPILCPSINNCLENMKKNATLESDFWDENYKLQDSDRITLEHPFTVEELEEVVFGSEASGASDSDVFIFLILSAFLRISER
jgi:hypothetical protein